MLRQEREVEEKEREAESKSKEAEKEVERLQALVAQLSEKNENGPPERSSKESEKEVKRLQALVAELVEEDELTKIKMKNCKKVAEEKEEKSKDTINNLKEVKGLLQEELRQLKKDLEEAKATKATKIDVKLEDKDELENTNAIVCQENEELRIQIKDLMESKEQANVDFSTIAKFKNLKIQKLKSELSKYKLLESVFYSKQKTNESSDTDQNKVLAEELKKSKTKIENLEASVTKMKDTISKLMNVLKNVKGGEKAALSDRILELEKSEANVKEMLSNEIINSTELELKVDHLEKKLKRTQESSRDGNNRSKRFSANSAPPMLAITYLWPLAVWRSRDIISSTINLLTANKAAGQTNNDSRRTSSASSDDDEDEFSVSRILGQISSELEEEEMEEVVELTGEAETMEITDEVFEMLDAEVAEINNEIINAEVADEVLDLVDKDDDDVEVVKEVEVISMDDDPDDFEVEEMTLSERLGLAGITPTPSRVAVPPTPKPAEEVPEESPQASTSKTFVPKCYLCNTWFQDMEFLKKHSLKWHAATPTSENTVNTDPQPKSSNPKKPANVNVLPNKQTPSLNVLYACEVRKCDFKSSLKEGLRAHRREKHGELFATHTVTQQPPVAAAAAPEATLRPERFAQQTVIRQTRVEQSTNIAQTRRESPTPKSYLVPGTAVWVEIVDFVRKWMNENIPCFDPNLPHNNLNVTTRSKVFFQVPDLKHIQKYKEQIQNTFTKQKEVKCVLLRRSRRVTWPTTAPWTASASPTTTGCSSPGSWRSS